MTTHTCHYRLTRHTCHFALATIAGNNILPSNCTDGDMRLVSPPEMIEGGSALLYVTGRVEVCFNHAWGTVCQSEWQFSNHDAAMICQQLGLSPEGKHKNTNMHAKF